MPELMGDDEHGKDDNTRDNSEQHLFYSPQRRQDSFTSRFTGSQDIGKAGSIQGTMTFEGQLDEIDPDRIDRIEVVRGEGPGKIYITLK